MVAYLVSDEWDVDVRWDHDEPRIEPRSQTSFETLAEAEAYVASKCEEEPVWQGDGIRRYYDGEKTWRIDDDDDFYGA